ncbi:MAG: hypothetical protein KME20_24675 [Kaiparowitsia implicata GSE-PSE-MK54-09C]|jgi:hypothetical protein|nr:hypothetical protein [Kaiparowitsia implicata GSE-PSE-MK54-09C]
MNPSVTEMFKLAQDRGCVLNMMLHDGVLFYWVENQHFIGKPCQQLEELMRIVHALPTRATSEYA